ncbi:hypothetical protein F4824DRAFT_240721 [Ustulina deusta]|nr:hypothetical protein F4824DRAFT_240721 [Ustulina deusta]
MRSLTCNPYYEDLCGLVRQGLEEGWVAETELDGRTYRRGKIALPSAETRFFSITTVYMESEGVFSGQVCHWSPLSPLLACLRVTNGLSGHILYHAHPYGEINCVVQVDDTAELEGMNGWRGAGWTSPGPGTHHYPRVRKGALVALFFLPAGRISYKATPDMKQPLSV